MASAIVMIVILYGMSDFIKIQSFDARGIQAHELPRIVRELEGNLNATVVTSSAEDVSGNLDELIAAEATSLQSRGYSLELIYNATSNPITADICITRQGMRFEKKIFLG
ncbi:MAG: hypothetical protein KAJ24_04170 [Candidatus Aenigmarchaeota archaeon]|nr:hypothetical protein [Candidatus Aenigmarchaeota archaeon]